MFTPVYLLRLAARAGFVPGDQVRRAGAATVAGISHFTLAGGQVLAHHGGQRTPLVALELVGSSHHPDLAALDNLLGQLQVLLAAEAILAGRPETPDPREYGEPDGIPHDPRLDECADEELAGYAARDQEYLDDDPTYWERDEADEPGELPASSFD